MLNRKRCRLSESTSTNLIINAYKKRCRFESFMGWPFELSIAAFLFYPFSFSIRSSVIRLISDCIVHMQSPNKSLFVKFINWCSIFVCISVCKSACDTSLEMHPSFAYCTPQQCKSQIFFWPEIALMHILHTFHFIRWKVRTERKRQEQMRA